MNDGQLGLVAMIVDTFSQPMDAWHNKYSDVVDAAMLEAFGDFLKLHHSLSSAYLDKTRFETALERILNQLGRRAKRPTSQTNRGHDITIDGEKWSLKTQGDKKIKEDMLFISKYMELGGGNWGSNDIADIDGLRNQFLRHLDGYDRIFQLRYFHRHATNRTESHKYELVEIPKTLMSEARIGTLTWAKRSKTTPRCAYCDVTESNGETKYRLYFDGGGERKLQIKNLHKSHCVVHASWEFSTATPSSSDDS